jgi:hypothetical protein
MNSPVVHWGSRELRKNLDDLVRDPQRPQTCPLNCLMDLMGRIRVWLAAEDGNLVAYGFGGQRVALPAKSVSEVHTVSSFRTRGIRYGPALLVLDHERRILLRASGRWETYGELAAVCRAAKVPTPTHLVTTLKPRNSSRAGSRSGGRQARRNTTLIPRFTKAPGYRKVRTRPRGTTLRVLAQAVLFLLTMGLGAFIGVLPAVALPEWNGRGPHADRHRRSGARHGGRHLGGRGPVAPDRRRAALGGHLVGGGHAGAGAAVLPPP